MKNVHETAIPTIEWRQQLTFTLFDERLFLLKPEK
jgi:hypothetical protein